MYGRAQVEIVVFLVVIFRWHGANNGTVKIFLAREIDNVGNGNHDRKTHTQTDSQDDAPFVLAVAGGNWCWCRRWRLRQYFDIAEKDGSLVVGESNNLSDVGQ